MTDSPRFPGISVLNPCFLEAFGHHLVALDLAVATIGDLSGQELDMIGEELLNSAVKRYSEMSPDELMYLTERFLGYARQIAQQQR